MTTSILSSDGIENHYGVFHTLIVIKIDKANALNKYFSTVFTKENTNSLPTFDGLSYPLIDDMNSGVVSLLQDLDVHKACDPDGIFPCLLKKLL